MDIRDVILSTLYLIKSIEPEDVLIVCLYVDDLILTGNNPKMIAEFKEAVIIFQDDKFGPNVLFSCH